MEQIQRVVLEKKAFNIRKKNNDKAFWHVEPITGPMEGTKLKIFFEWLVRSKKKTLDSDPAGKSRQWLCRNVS